VDIERAVGRGGYARRLLVVLLFGLTLALLALGNLIVIPNSSGFYDPVDGLRTAAFVSALVLFVVALPERESRRVLALLLGALGATLLILNLSGVDYRFIAQSDEGEFSIMIIALLAAAGILFSMTAIQLGGGVVAARQHSNLGGFAARVMWSTPLRKGIVVGLGVFYSIALIVVLASSEFNSGGISADEVSDLLLGLLVCAVAGFAGSRVPNPTLKVALWLVAALIGVGVLLATGLGLFLIVIALHAAIAFAALAASAVVVDARSSGAKAGYSLLTAVATAAWVLLALYGLFIFALLTSGYES
jgi:hypothetical protein